MMAPATCAPLTHLLIVVISLSLLNACGGGGSGGLPGGVPPVTITITPATPAITAGLTQQLSATLTNPDSSVVDVTKTAKWTSDSPSNATVDASTGIVTAVRPGSAKITATVNAASGSTTVTVTPPTMGWALTGSMATARESHTATRLANGAVLIAGGQNTGVALASAEIFNPSTGTWSTTGTMAAPRTQQTATLLPNGTVLVAGGGTTNGVNPMASAEVYDPAAGTWSATGTMTMARVQHTATLLPNGTILVAGGTGNDGNPQASAEIYNPGAGTWTATGSMTAVRRSHTATLLSNGLVLVAGGFSSSVACDLSFTACVVNSAELYDPKSGTWTATGSMSTERASYTATLLASGNVLVAGGFYSVSRDDVSTNVAEIFDPVAGTWTVTGSLAIARDSHTATLLTDGNVLVAGGEGPDQYSNQQFASAENFDSTTAMWAVTGSMSTARVSHTATLLTNGSVLVAGGDGPSANTMNTIDLASADIYYP